MSVAQGQTTIRWTSKGATYNAYVTCAWGDLYQFWSGTAGAYTYVPMYGAMADGTQPELYLHVTSSRASETIQLSGLKVYVNDTEINFVGGKSIAPWKDVFQIVYDANNLPGVRVIKDFGDECARTSFTIKLEATCIVNDAASGETIAATYNVQVSQGTSDDIKAMIYEVPISNVVTNFTIQKETDVCRLGAVLRKGNNSVTSGLTYQWQRWDASTGTWVNTAVNGTALGTGATLDVSEGMVNTYEMFQCVVTHNDNGVQTEYADTQGVWDAQDPYEIFVTTFPEDATILDGDTSAKVVVFPKVCYRKDNTASTGITTFQFSLFDSVGQDRIPTPKTTYDYAGLNVAANTPGAFAVTYDIMNQIGADATLVISAIGS